MFGIGIDFSLEYTLASEDKIGMIKLIPRRIV